MSPPPNLDGGTGIFWKIQKGVTNEFFPKKGVLAKWGYIGSKRGYTRFIEQLIFKIPIFETKIAIFETNVNFCKKNTKYNRLHSRYFIKRIINCHLEWTLLNFLRKTIDFMSRKKGVHESSVKMGVHLKRGGIASKRGYAEGVCKLFLTVQLLQ